MNYAEIVIANANENLDRVFHYGVPENLRNIIEVGMRVYVPFGKGNHRTEGYVIGFTDEIDFDKSKIIQWLKVMSLFHKKGYSLLIG